jgi:hypothetical protein
LYCGSSAYSLSAFDASLEVAITWYLLFELKH